MASPFETTRARQASSINNHADRLDAISAEAVAGRLGALYVVVLHPTPSACGPVNALLTFVRSFLDAPMPA